MHATGWVLDVPAITRFARVDPYAQAVVWAAVEQGSTLLVPATALTVAFARSPVSVHDAIGVLLDLPVTLIDALDRSRAGDAGLLLAQADEPDEVPSDWSGMAAAHVVAACRVRGWPVVTDGTAAIHSIDPRVEVKLLKGQA